MASSSVLLDQPNAPACRRSKGRITRLPLAVRQSVGAGVRQGGADRDKVVLIETAAPSPAHHSSICLRRMAGTARSDPARPEDPAHGRSGTLPPAQTRDVLLQQAQALADDRDLGTRNRLELALSR